MGLIQKKEEHEVVDGIEVIERSDVPEDLPQVEVDLVEGESAEDIAGDGSDGGGDGGSGNDGGSHDGDAADSGDGEPRKPGCGVSKVFVAAAAVLVVIAAIGGYFFGSGGFGAKGAGSATVEEGQLDAAVARYTYGGATKTLTVREVIEDQYSLETAQDEDGNYAVPTADTTLAYVRNRILLDEAAARGIEPTDDEIAEYAVSTIGTSDYSEMSEQYGLSEEQAKSVVKDQLTLKQLYDEVVGEVSAQAPEAPTEPADGDTSAASKEYADYIIALAGDEWDAEKGTWASEDGAYATALAGQDFTADSATYEQALTAYYTAYQEYSSVASEANTTYRDFCNTLFASADVTLLGLFV